MKPKLFLLILLISFMTFSCKEKVIDVQKEGASKTATNHKEKDVEIYQSKNLFTDDILNFSYQFGIYSNVNGKLIQRRPSVWSFHDNSIKQNMNGQMIPL